MVNMCVWLRMILVVVVLVVYFCGWVIYYLIFVSDNIDTGVEREREVVVVVCLCASGISKCVKIPPRLLLLLLVCMKRKTFYGDRDTLRVKCARGTRWNV